MAITVNTPQATLTESTSITKGEYVFNLALGCGCHMNENPLKGLSGGEDFSDPSYGKLFARNITPDHLTGIGNYTTTQIETILRTGKTPEGEQLFPVMPYMSFSGIAKDDMANLIAFILAQTPVSNTVPPRELTVPVAPFTPTIVPSDTAPISGVVRGQYILEHLADCRGCHGPNLGGTPGFAPNITSDPTYGIGLLSVEQISKTLRTGVRPTISDSLRFDGEAVRPPMAFIIAGNIAPHWTVTDVTSIAEYLKTIPPVGNQAPAIGPIANVTTTVGASFVYTAAVNDVDVFDVLTVTAVSKPAWLGVGPTFYNGLRPTTGGVVLTGTTTISDVGVAPVTLMVADAGGLTSTATFTLTTISEVTPVSPTINMPSIFSQQSPTR
jgi:mono/diheme cytochrome c family protein